jgi:hypothetical protein
MLNRANAGARFMLDEMVVHTVQRYAGVGYTDRFETAPGGLRSESTGRVHPPHSLEAEHVVALGVATPEAGETLLFAVHSRVDDSRGTWVVARDASLPREAARLADRLAATNPKRTWTSWRPFGSAVPYEFVLEGMMVGVIGASIVAVWFLLVDFLTRDSLFTPSLVGDFLFGPDTDAHALPVDLERISAVIVLHGLAFIAIGIAAAWFVSRFVEHPTRLGLFVALFALLEGFFVIVSEVAMPGAARQIGHAWILAANALAAGGMALYLRRSRHVRPRPVQSAPPSSWPGVPNA